MARATIDFLYSEANALRDLTEEAAEKNLPGLCGDALSNLTGVGAVVHEEKFNVFFVSDEKLPEARSEHVSGLLVLLAADLGLPDPASEASSHTGVNTSLLPPRSLKANATLASRVETVPKVPPITAVPPNQCGQPGVGKLPGQMMANCLP